MSHGRVARVSAFARRATTVACEATTESSQRAKRKITSRQRHDAATEETATPRPENRLGTSAVCGATVMPVTAATTAPGASDATQEAGILITLPPDAARLEAPPGMQIGARAHRAASAGGGIRVTATIDDAVDEDAQNDAVSRR